MNFKLNDQKGLSPAFVLFTAAAMISLTGFTIKFVNDSQREIDDEISYQEDLIAKSNVEIIKKDLAREKQGGEGKTTDWQIYRNEETGFEIKYPVKFNVVSTSSGADIRETITGGNFNAVGFVRKGEYALDVAGIWSVLPLTDVVGQKKLYSENRPINGVEFKKEYWAIRTAGAGNWLTNLRYYGCAGNNCFSILKGIEVFHIEDGIETGGKNALGQDIADQAVISGIKEKMDASQNEDAVLFNQIVSTFKLIE